MRDGPGSCQRNICPHLGHADCCPPARLNWLLHVAHVTTAISRFLPFSVPPQIVVLSTPRCKQRSRRHLRRREAAPNTAWRPRHQGSASTPHLSTSPDAEGVTDHSPGSRALRSATLGKRKHNPFPKTLKGFQALTFHRVAQPRPSVPSRSRSLPPGWAALQDCPWLRNLTQSPSSSHCFSDGLQHLPINEPGAQDQHNRCTKSEFAECEVEHRATFQINVAAVSP